MMTEAHSTPLMRVLAERIVRDGPISVRDYMDACLHDPEHGYYRTRNAIGANEDFITAPEISQVFGELIGLWAAVAWQQMGSPGRVRLVELGPGRGTLMRDALRVSRAAPAFRDALDVVLVEPNAALQAIQRDVLDGVGVPINWHAEFADAAETATGGDATIVIANEVLDVFPVAQLQRADGGWFERSVGLNDAGRLIFGVQSLRGAPPELPIPVPVGDILERRDTSAITAPLRRLADAGRLAALFIDYGYYGPAIGDTLQAIRAQRFEDPLGSPGMADLTAHVDFSAFADDARSVGLIVDGPRDQGAFLGALGIVERTSRLMAANPASAGILEAATARLLSPTGMGSRFKVIGLRAGEVGLLPGL